MAENNTSGKDGAATKKRKPDEQSSEPFEKHSETSDTIAKTKRRPRRMNSPDYEEAYASHEAEHPCYQCYENRQVCRVGSGDFCTRCVGKFYTQCNVDQEIPRYLGNAASIKKKLYEDKLLEAQKKLDKTGVWQPPRMHISDEEVESHMKKHGFDHDIARTRCDCVPRFKEKNGCYVVEDYSLGHNELEKVKSIDSFIVHTVPELLRARHEALEDMSPWKRVVYEEPECISEFQRWAATYFPQFEGSF
ncbi:unnamed protein product [Sympodiomycopsis kandeliae]